MINTILLDSTEPISMEALQAFFQANDFSTMDAKVSSDQSHPQRATTHTAVDAAYLTANLLGIFDDDDEVEDCTTRYYGPTLSM